MGAVLTLGATLLALAMATPAAAGESPLLGAWRITSQTTTLTDVSGKATTYRREPVGQIVVTPGRLMLMVAADRREPPTNDAEKVALFDAFIAYTGKVEVEPDRFILTLDNASNMARIGLRQVRYYEVDGDRLTIRTPPSPAMLKPGLTSVTILTAVRER